MARNRSHMSVPDSGDVNAAERVAQALHLRRMGFNYTEIAKRVGYADHSGASKAIRRELNKLIHGEAQELAEHQMRLQLDRLDYALEKAVMPALERGDLEAARTLTILLKHQAELLALYPKEVGPRESFETLIDADLSKATGQNLSANGSRPHDAGVPTA